MKLTPKQRKLDFHRWQYDRDHAVIDGIEQDSTEPLKRFYESYPQLYGTMHLPSTEDAWGQLLRVMCLNLPKMPQELKNKASVWLIERGRNDGQEQIED